MVDHTLKLVEHLSSAAATPLPPEVVHKTKHHLIDTVAAMVSGATLPAGKRGLAYIAANRLGAGTHCSMAVGGRRTVPVDAALANGMSAHADETDDSHPRSFSHPGCAVIPAALAVADLRRSSGQQLLRAIAAGYDVGSRAVLSLGEPELDTDSSDLSTHSYCGVFGAAAAAAVIYGLDATSCRYVLSYTAQSASGVTSWVRDPNHIEKAFVFGGMPASNGVRAAALVAAGCDGVDDVFCGVPNFLDALSDDARPHELSDSLGERYEILHTNIKKFAVGSPAQAAIQAVLELIDEEPIAPESVDRIRISLPHGLVRIVDDRLMPDICCQYLVAGTLIDQGFSFAMAHDTDRMTDPRIVALRDRTELVPDPLRATVRTAEVTMTLNDGRERSRFVGAVRGTVDNPMSDSEVSVKASDLMEPVLGAARSAQLLELLWDVDSCADIAAITDLLGSVDSESD